MRERVVGWECRLMGIERVCYSKQKAVIFFLCETETSDFFIFCVCFYFCIFTPSLGRRP
jgi:hypothetical protein